MLQPTYHTILNSYFRINSAQNAGCAVSLDSSNEGFVLPASGNGHVIGLLAQDVTVTGPTYVLGSVSPEAKVGDAVGVYMGQGQFLTDQLSSSCNINSLLYVDPANPGQLTSVQPSGGVAVARAMTASGAVQQTQFGTTYNLTQIWFFGAQQ